MGVVCLAVSGVILAITPSFPSGQATAGLTGPAFFPNLLAIIYILCGVYQLRHGTRRAGDYRAIRPETAASLAADGRTRSAWIFIGLNAGFVLLLDFLGFIVASLIFLVLLMKKLGVTLPKAALYAFIFTGTIYLLFVRLFAISLPSGILSHVGF